MRPPRTGRIPQGSAGNAILNGVTPDDFEASADPDARVAEPGRAGLVQIRMNADTIQNWSNGSEENYGWSIVTDSGSRWEIDSSAAFLAGPFAPELTVFYTAPDPASAGTFSLSTDEYFVQEADLDFNSNPETATATITVNRIGGSDGTRMVDWALSDGSGLVSEEVISGPTSGTITFAPGELLKTFEVSLDGNEDVQANRTLNITLSGDGLDFDRSETTLTIRDNDFDANAGSLLLNELWINSPGNDPPHEFVEIKGVPGVGMGSLYYVAIEGLIGDREGSAEKVVDLGSFSNGAAAADGNGYTLLTPDAADFHFRVPDGVTQIDGLGSIGSENVSTANDSTTYLILFSPNNRLTTTEFDYDWDNDGALELPTGVRIVDSIGVRVFGATDQLYGPATNRISFAVNDEDVDAVSRASE